MSARDRPCCKADCPSDWIRVIKAFAVILENGKLRSSLLPAHIIFYDDNSLSIQRLVRAEPSSHTRAALCGDDQ